MVVLDPPRPPSRKDPAFPASRSTAPIGFKDTTSTSPICFNTIQDALHQAPLLFHHFSPSTSSSLRRLLHYKDGGACWNLHAPMQPQLRAYPYAYTLLPLYYISTSLSHWLSWPLGSNRGAGGIRGGCLVWSRVLLLCYKSRLEGAHRPAGTRCNQRVLMRAPSSRAFPATDCCEQTEANGSTEASTSADARAISRRTAAGIA